MKHIVLNIIDLLWQGKNFDLKLGGVSIVGRRGWAVLDIMFRTGKAWALNLMLAGLWVSTYLDQPDLDDLGDDPSDEDLLAKRKWKVGFNYFQKIKGAAD